MDELKVITAIFNPGKIVVTAGVSNRCMNDSDFHKFVISSCARHLQGDWGDLEYEEDRKANDAAVKEGDFRIMSAYNYGDDPKETIWIITEGDHSATTVLFPSEY